jgi:hypothetical protein
MKETTYGCTSGCCDNGLLLRDRRLHLQLGRTVQGPGEVAPAHRSNGPLERPIKEC